MTKKIYGGFIYAKGVTKYIDDSSGSDEVKHETIRLTVLALCGTQVRAYWGWIQTFKVDAD